MFAEIINQAITTTAWTGIKSVGSFASCHIAIQSADDTAFNLSRTGSDSDPYITIKDGGGIGFSEVRLNAGVEFVYAKSIAANCTIQLVIKRL